LKPFNKMMIGDAEECRAAGHPTAEIAFGSISCIRMGYSDMPQHEHGD